MSEKAENVNKKKLSIKDVVTVAIMLALFLAFSLATGAATVTMPIVYLYVAAGIEMFIGAIFYLVAANRINKHGLLFIWNLVYGLITAAAGYLFMLPYFVALGLVCELVMLGKDAYRKPIRNMFGWSTYGAGMFFGIAIPIWVAWESFKQQALEGGFSPDTLEMQYNVVTTPLLFSIGVAITVALSIMGVLFAQQILKKHFKKAGILD